MKNLAGPSVYVLAVCVLPALAAAAGGSSACFEYSDEAGSHLTFQVIGSRLKPGCAEDQIVNGVLGLYGRSDQ